MRSFLVAVVLVASPVLHVSWADDSKQTLPPAPSAGPIISIPKAINGSVGQLIEVKAETGADLVTWKATEGLRIVNDDPPDPARKVVLIHAKAAGVYALAASIPAEKGTRLAVAIVTITDGDKPKPDPDPPVVTDPVSFIVVIEETGEATANRGAMFAQVALKLKEKKIGWRVADQNVVDATGKPPADLAPYLGKAKGKPLPQVFLVAANGKLIYQGDLPKDADGLLALLARYVG